MPVLPEDFLDSANKYMEGGKEMDLRNAASRAYYSTFHICKQFVDSKNLPFATERPGSSHDDLINRFKEHAVRSDSKKADMTLRQIGIVLYDGKKTRGKADYDIEAIFPLADAEKALKIAVRIKALIAGLTS